jgi:hypothetical protein
MLHVVAKPIVITDFSQFCGGAEIIKHLKYFNKNIEC